MHEKPNERDEQTPSDAALAFVATLLAGMPILALACSTRAGAWPPRLGRGVLTQS